MNVPSLLRSQMVGASDQPRSTEASGTQRKTESGKVGAEPSASVTLPVTFGRVGTVYFSLARPVPGTLKTVAPARVLSPPRKTSEPTLSAMTWILMSPMGTYAVKAPLEFNSPQVFEADQPPSAFGSRCQNTTH